MILIYNHPLYIFLILSFLMVLSRIISEGKRLKSIIKFSLYNVLLIIIINPLVNHSGRTVLIQSPSMPVIGKIKITGEALAYGANMGLKLICILLIFLIYDIMTDRDDTFSFFSKFAHKLTLTFSMASNIIHRLTIESMRVKDVMEMRGVNFKEKKIINRIKSYYPLLKVIFISSLEGSIDRAEALHSRSYGKCKRTSYVDLKMIFMDYLFVFIALILLTIFLWGLFYDVGAYQFYPRLQAFIFKDFIWLGILACVLICTLFIVWGCKHWKFLKLKI
ncbi:MAG: energy-coupling factor transporter transmembrane protein EcfT [Clostridia bacterium]|nr:energy-coupling factor transporter transmembrane protein EcfT [Clostridia bacterium]